MKTKKKYKLKLWPKIMLIVIIILGILGYYGYGYYQDYLYKQTDEYHLLQLGYSKKETKILLDNLNDKEIDKILTYDYDEFIPQFVGKKYFMFKHLDDYLSQVIKQEDDFFKYHGIDGYDYDDIIAKVNTNAYLPPYSKVSKTNLDDGVGILVNKYTQLGVEYQPQDLVSIPLKYRFGGEKKIRKEVYNAFLKMWEAANNDGYYLIVDSAYRSGSSQSEVYKYYEDLKGTEKADLIAARPGFSEHQTGLSIDLYSKECADAKKFENSKTYKWLINNSYKFGFILRYPKGKRDITGYDYESWHYRYLGVDLATKVYESKLTYDEYYAFYLDK